jgi:para-nitrobenzyl esterase
MKKLLLSVFSLFLALAAMAQGPQVTVEGGIIEGVDSSGVKIFRGVPYAAPPVGNLRWRNPQPVVAWQGVRSAKEFGANPIQKNAFGDMVFGTKKFSEDCLYLNIWTPTKNYNEKLPVLIYFNGGGFTSGSGSEPRYQGLTLARKGVIIVTVNYREGIFGGFASTLLSKENSKNEGYKGSGNQGLMDQAAAINWVHRNIAAFGGDPSRITICGESAGSSSVNAQQTSMMARGSFSQLIGSSASILSNTPMNTLADAEKAGDAFMKAAGCKTLAQLRSLPAEKINELYKPTGYPLFCIDGKFFTEQPSETYRKGTYAQVPALVGNNNCEVPVMIFMGGKAPTLENLKPFIKQRFKTEDVDKILNLYNIHSDADIVNRPGYELGGDLFVAYSTWKWLDALRQTSKAPVYRYLYCHPRPANNLPEDKEPGIAGGTSDKKSDAPVLPPNPGAVHSSDIEYSMGNLPTNHMFKWNENDYQVSEIFQQIYLNFIKTGNPNGLGLPQWDTINGKTAVPVMHIDLKTQQMVTPQLEVRYREIDKYL